MKTSHTVGVSLSLALLWACSAGSDSSNPGEKQLASTGGCVDGVEEYIDPTTGEEVICVYTDEPGDPYEPPPDICWLYPEFCYPEPPPPEPTDPCVIDPESCTTGGGETPLPVCNPAGEEIPADFQQSVNSRVETCFQQNWAAVPFMEESDPVNYQPGSGGFFYSIGDWISNNVTGCVIQNIDWVFYSNSAGGQIMQNLVNRLNQQAAAQNLTPHQKICSAMCVSSKLITYSLQNMYNVLPSGAVTSGLGVCRDFAQIGERLLDGMGFSSSTVGSLATQHAFVEVTSPEGGSYYVEPQPSKCIFYNRH